MKDEYDFSNGKRGAVVPPPPNSILLTRIWFDEEVINWFRQQVIDAAGGNYHRLMNQALRDHIEREKALQKQASAVPATEEPVSREVKPKFEPSEDSEETQEDMFRRVVREELALAGLTVGS